MKRRLVYLGTPALAVPTLKALHEAGHEIALVVTRADAKRGRGGELSPSPVKAAAVELGLRVSHDPSDVLTTSAELGVVVAYGRLISKELLDAVPMLNLHFSLLPRWRGAAPVERALLEGDAVTGICIMGLEETLDTGPIYAQVEVPIAPDATLHSLRAELVDKGTNLMVETLAVELPDPVIQDGEPIYADKITSETLRIDFHQSAQAIERVVRLGKAWTTFRGKRLGVWQVLRVSTEDFETSPGQLAPGEVNSDGHVGTDTAPLLLIEVQPESKKRMTADSWLNGARPNPRETLGVQHG
jgi:methionyl-tRNA formyltransferase